MRPIDADALMRDIEHYHLSDGKFQHWVEVQPTIEERKTGRWEDVHIDVANDDKGRSYRFYSCTACGVTSIPAMLGMKKEWLHFCPNCGADMRGEQYG